jgi:hypothetical protein
VKNYFAEHKKEFNLQYARVASEVKKGTGHGFLFITEKPASLEEILAAFPPKSTTDVLISRFFNTYNYDPAFRESEPFFSQYVTFKLINTRNHSWTNVSKTV